MSVITVPLHAHPSWSPAWEPMRLGETLPRGLDATQWAQAEGLVVSSIEPSTDPALAATGDAVVSGATCMLDLVAGGAPGTEPVVAFRILFAGRVDERLIVVRQPILAGAPAGLVAVSVHGLAPALSNDNGQRLTDDYGLSLRSA